MKIDLQKECQRKTITREDGKKINDLIINIWNKENKIIIDFGHVLIASVSFFDEAFGKLAFEFSRELLKNKLEFINIENFDKALLNDILFSRYRQKELKQNGSSRQ